MGLTLEGTSCNCYSPFLFLLFNSSQHIEDFCIIIGFAKNATKQGYFPDYLQKMQIICFLG